MNRFLFEIITEGEVAKHLKKGTMTGSLTDILDIAGTNTFLTGTSLLFSAESPDP